MTEATNTKTPKLGQLTQDGVYAGLTDDGKQQIYAMPTDLKTRFLKRPTMSFNDAAERVENLNAKKALGHDDWRIPSLDVLHVLQVYQNEDQLKGTFKTVSGRDCSDSPDCYWSSTPDYDIPLAMEAVCFSDGGEGLGDRDFGRLSCRPVRLVPVAAPSLG